jgi:hypothetical protein
LFGDTLFVIFSDEISPCAVSKDQACGSIVVSCRGTLGCDACEPLDHHESLVERCGWLWYSGVCILYIH